MIQSAVSLTSRLYEVDVAGVVANANGQKAAPTSHGTSWRRKQPAMAPSPRFLDWEACNLLCVHQWLTDYAAIGITGDSPEMPKLEQGLDALERVIAKHS